MPDGTGPQSLNRTAIFRARFSFLVRQGLRFRRRFENAKQSIGPVPFEWYRYDSFPNLFYLHNLLKRSGLSFEEIVSNKPVLDIGAADGALSFFLESLGCRVQAIDFSGSNMNGMRGLRQLAAHLASAVEIRDCDLDGRFDLTGQYDLAFFLGILYHLKNPFYALETLAKHSRYCFLSTWVTRLGPDRVSPAPDAPFAYVLEPSEVNGDATNYFVFSPAGLNVLVRRAGWTILASLDSGTSAIDTIMPRGDGRMYLFLETAVGK